MYAMTPEVLDIALSLMEGLHCPRAVTAAIMLRYGEWDQLVRLKADPLHYSCADSYLGAAASSDFLRKCVDIPLTESGPSGEPSGKPLDLEEQAIEKWSWSEHECCKTNLRLYRIIDGDLDPSVTRDAFILDFVSRMKKNIREMIGDGPPQTWDGRFGPGATVTDKSLATTVADKMSSTPSFTPNALFHLVPWIGTKWASATAELGMKPVSVRGNTFFSVPKDALARRGCAKEPSVNGFYQLGLGRILKRRLFDAGINLRDGKSIHMRVACDASYSDDFCTLDLTSASDCVAIALVQLAMPHRWFEAMSSLRSPLTLVDGKFHRLEKFSSMGNGFTFELETTLFAGIVKTCIDMVGPSQGIPGHNMWVYGDDIIAPSDCSNVIQWALKYFGFTLNRRKSFSTGPFRESCGGDFWMGVAVRPYFLESLPNEPQQLISMANGIRNLASQGTGSRGLFDRLRPAWFKCLDSLPTAIRSCRGPQALGDLVIHDDERYWSTRWRGQIRYLRVYRPATYKIVRWEGYAYSVQFAAALYGVRLRLIPNKPRVGDLDHRYMVPRDGVTGYKVGWTTYS